MSDASATIEPAAVETAAPETVSEVPSVAELAALMGLPAEQKPEVSQQAAEGAEKPEGAATEGNEGNEAEAGTISDETKPAAGEAESAEQKPEGAQEAAEGAEKQAEPPAVDPLKKQIEELQAEISALKAAKPEPKAESQEARAETVPPPQPLRAEYFGLDALTLQEVRAAEQVKRWAEANPEGGEVAGADGQPETISPARVQSLLAESNGILAAARQAGRERFAEARRQADDYVRVHYPALLEKKSQEHAVYERILKTVPELANMPDLRLQVGRMLKGFALEQEEIKQRQAAATKAPAKETVVPKAPAAGAVPRAATARTKPQASQRDQQLADLRKRAEAGDQSAAEQYFAMQG